MPQTAGRITQDDIEANFVRIEKIQEETARVLRESIEDTTQAMAVEVKTTLKRDEVDYHVERMGKIRRHADLHDDKRQYFGAMAASVVDDQTRRYALNRGFYLIEPSGEDVMIVEPGEVKAW